ncbi:aminotransferase class I/II-fold pyridoxal phosphate-dependent enzyme [Pedobacter jamesrossensis]|uniref:Aminotransferase class I/II-fold pyridoxal phosphate-dependent enzyme n=1 Tax=Pedobacter jamesrossensis TaxID=1908238 RepID=A0ABV8NP49_9SPHI
MSAKFKSLTQPFSNSIHINGKDYLYFGGTAYLGIPQNQAFIDLYIEGIKKFGLNNGTSRNNNIQLGIYSEAEKIAAYRFKAEDALVTSSGYLAAQLTVKELSSFGNMLYAPGSHPALWLETQMDALMSFKEWAVKTVETINSSPDKNWVLISNSMNNLIPEIYDFDFLKSVDKDKKIILIVDDSHGIGVNNNGLGAFSNLPELENIENVVVASMAKALGVDAGLVLASSKIISQLKNTSTFIGASPPSAAGLYAFILGEKIYQKALKELKDNILSFQTAANLAWKFELDFPVFLLGDADLAEKLLQKQILISSFPYPTPSDKLLNRIVLSSWHTESNIATLISALL